MFRENPYAMTTEVQPQYNNRSAAVASTVKPEKHPLRLAMCFEIPPYQSSNSKFDRHHSLKSRNSECFFLATEALLPLSTKKYIKKHPYFQQKA